MHFVKYAREEKQHISPTMPRRIVKIGWQQKITKKEALRGTGLTDMHFTVSVGFAGLVTLWGWATSEFIQKSMLYSELAIDTHKCDRPKLSFKDVCKRDLKSYNVGTDKWEELANNRDKWRSFEYKSFKDRKNQFFKRPK